MIHLILNKQSHLIKMEHSTLPMLHWNKKFSIHLNVILPSTDIVPSKVSTKCLLIIVYSSTILFKVDIIITDCYPFYLCCFKI